MHFSVAIRFELNNYCCLKKPLDINTCLTSSRGWNPSIPKIMVYKNYYSRLKATFIKYIIHVLFFTLHSDVNSLTIHSEQRCLSFILTILLQFTKTPDSTFCLCTWVNSKLRIVGYTDVRSSPYLLFGEKFTVTTLPRSTDLTQNLPYSKVQTLIPYHSEI